MERKDKRGIALGILSILCALLICGLPITLWGFDLGWVFGFVLGILGVARSCKAKKMFSTKIGLILSIVGIVASVANLVMGIVVSR